MESKNEKEINFFKRNEMEKWKTVREWKTNAEKLNKKLRICTNEIRDILSL